MKILLTGSGGFVGKNLSAYLKNFGSIDIVPINVRAPLHKLQFSEGDVIIHLAGKAHDLKRTSDDEEYFTVNRDITIALFNQFIDSNTRDFIFFSSVKAAADTLDEILDEEFSPQPLTPYGQSKLQAENYLLNQKLPEGKRLIILRPCMIHGPGNKGNLNLLYSVVKRGIPYPLAAFQNKRSFLSIANLSYIIDKIICDSEIPGGIYNVADDEPLSTNQVITLIAEASNIKPKLWAINASLIKAVAKVGDALRLPLNSERLKKLTESYVVSNDKVKNALKIDKLPISSSEGLLNTIKSFHSS